MSAQKNLTVITVPLKVKQQLAKIEKIKQAKENVLKLKQKRLYAPKTCPVLSCKNIKLNQNKGQTYKKFETVTLASEKWKSRKAKGDFFLLHNHDQNPAFLGDFDDGLDNFDNLGLDTEIVNKFNDLGFNKPTDIQRKAIPRLLEGSNTVIAAETGNGKTLAFLAPLIQQILYRKQNFVEETDLNSPRALIITPSRELVIQTRDMARKMVENLNVNVNSMVGGRIKRFTLQPKFTDMDILIGSFGALSKLFTNQIYKRGRVRHIILDEADTLLDDSFNENVTHFLSKFPLQSDEVQCSEDLTGAQLTLVGATFPTSLGRILNGLIDTESMVEIRSSLLHRIPPNVTHKFLRISRTEKCENLLKIARRNYKLGVPTIIFSNSSKCCDWVSRYLNECGIPCVCVHGAMTAQNRSQKYRVFEQGSVNMLSATDIVSRGLDTARAKCVLNFDFPTYMSDFIHRCGRVGRVGSSDACEVINFVALKSEIDLVQKIEYAARKMEALPNVNANISRIMQARRERYEAKHNQKIVLEV